MLGAIVQNVVDTRDLCSPGLVPWYAWTVICDSLSDGEHDM